MAQDIFIAYRDGNLWGYADTLGQILIKPKYSSVSIYNDNSNIFIVEKEKQFGLINQNGELYTPIVYDKIRRASNSRGFFTVKNKMDGFLAANGDLLINNEYKNIYGGSNTLYLEDDSLTFKYCLEKRQIIDTIATEDELELEMDYEVCDLKYPSSHTYTNYEKIYRGNKIGIRKHSETVVRNSKYMRKSTHNYDTLPGRYNDILIVNGWNYGFVLVKKRNKWGAFVSDTLKIPIKYQEIVSVPINSSCKTYYLKVKKDNKWGIIDFSNQKKLDFVYDEICLGNLSNGNHTRCFDLRTGIAVKKKEKCGIVEFGDKVLLDFKYDSIVYNNSKPWNYYYLDDKKGIYSYQMNTGLIFKSNDKISNTTKVDNVLLIKMLDERDKLKGFVSPSGVFFYKD